VRKGMFRKKNRIYTNFEASGCTYSYDPADFSFLTRIADDTDFFTC